MSDIEILEEKYGGNKESLSMNEIILRHIRKLSDLSCQELTASWWDRKPLKVGGGVVMSEVYHPDLRMAFVSGVDFLLDLIYPYAMNEKIKEYDFMEELKKLEEEEDNLFKQIDHSKGAQDDWVRTKLTLRRRLFRHLMIFLEKSNFFEGELYGE